jgi:hypothetical protein
MQNGKKNEIWIAYTGTILQNTRPPRRFMHTKKAKKSKPNGDWMEDLKLRQGALRAKTGAKPGHPISARSEQRLANAARKSGDTRTLREVELAQEFAKTRARGMQRGLHGRFAKGKNYSNE